MNGKRCYLERDFGEHGRWVSSFPKPPVYPGPGHPRIMFTEKDLPMIRERLNAPENRYACEKYQELLKQEVRGMLPPLTSREDAYLLYVRLAAIEAKAFRYALLKDRKDGEEALDGIRDTMLSLRVVPGAFGDTCREYGYVMYIAACVYDWCYEILTEEEKRQLVAGCETHVGPFMEMGCPPLRQGAVTGHGTEAQLLRDYLALSIACYDEYPELYELCAGRVFSQYREPADFYLQSGCHCQGSSYGGTRFVSLLKAQWLVFRMTEGKVRLFGDVLENAAFQFIYNIRPDGESFRFGDDFQETKLPDRYLRTYDGRIFALTASFYGNPKLKEAARQELRDFSVFELLNGQLTPVLFLLTNDPELPCESIDSLPLIRFNPSPRGSVIGRTGWDRDAAAVYMKIGEAYSANHEHRDAGCFQLFFHGILASDSGAYASYGSPHDAAYNKQTISSNCMLVFNPNHRDNGRYLYSGGQKQDEETNRERATMEEWRSIPDFHRTKLLAHGETYLPDGSPDWIYLSGDLSNAYDEDTVKHYRRDMLALMTGDHDRPMLFFVCDDVTSEDPSYKKTFLLHVQEEPVFVSGSTAVIENRKKGGHGRLVAECVTEGAVMTVSGGPGREFLINGTNYPPDPKYNEFKAAEFGWGRVETSPQIPRRRDVLVHSFYVEDGEDSRKIADSTGIESDTVRGAFLLGRAAIFAVNGSREIGFDLPEAADTFVAGLPEGTYRFFAEGSFLGTGSVRAPEMLLRASLPGGHIVLRKE